LLEKWILFIRKNIKNKNNEPIKTWIPWNPVAMKKIEPKTPSENEKNDV